MSKKPQETLYQKNGIQNYTWLPDTGFVVGDRSILNYIDPIGTHGLALYYVLCAHADKTGQCWPSVETLAKKSGMSPNKVRQLIKLFVKHKIIRYVERNEKGRPKSNLYTLLLLPQAAVNTSPDEVLSLDDPAQDEPIIPHEMKDDTSPDEGGILHGVKPNETHKNQNQLNENHLERETRVGGDKQHCTEASPPLPASRSLTETNNRKAPDPYFSAFAHVCKIDPRIMSNKQQLQLGEAIRKFKEANIPPYLIYGFEEWWAEFWPDGGHPYIQQVMKQWGAYSESGYCCEEDVLKEEKGTALKADPLFIAILTACQWSIRGVGGGQLNYLANAISRLRLAGATPTDVYYVAAKIRREEPEKKLSNASFVVDATLDLCIPEECERLKKTDRAYFEAQARVCGVDPETDDREQMGRLVACFKDNKGKGIPLQAMLDYADRKEREAATPPTSSSRQAKKRKGPSKQCFGVLRPQSYGNPHRCGRHVSGDDFCSDHIWQKSLDPFTVAVGYCVNIRPSGVNSEPEMHLLRNVVERFRSLGWTADGINEKFYPHHKRIGDRNVRTDYIGLMIWYDGISPNEDERLKSAVASALKAELTREDLLRWLEEATGTKTQEHRRNGTGGGPSAHQSRYVATGDDLTSN